MTGMAAVGTYTATKHAILGLTRVAALELAHQRIRVNAICPGAVDTPMSNPAQLDPTADPEEMSRALDELYSKLVPLGRVGRPEEVARLALFLTSEDSSYITGQPFVIDGVAGGGQRSVGPATADGSSSIDASRARCNSRRQVDLTERQIRMWGR